MNKPFFDGECNPSGTCDGYRHIGKHSHAMRADDRKNIILYQNSDGNWAITPPWMDDVPVALFATRDEAALFACMSSRFYSATIETPRGERIQVKIYPNVGRLRFGLKQWVTSLYKENGDRWASNRYAESITEAKVIGAQLANPNMIPEAALGLCWDWEKD
jgi:hypothetical protein